MITVIQNRYLPVALGLCVSLAAVSMPDSAAAAVAITNDPATFGFLEKPTGKPDEPSFGGFNYWISGRDLPDFRANDQYLNEGDETLESNTIAFDLGKQPELSETPFNFSIQHDKGKNYSFSLTNTLTNTTSVLCWGIECPVGDVNKNSATLGGKTPITNWNGLQIQVRSQEVIPSSVQIENLTLTGVDIAPGSDPLFDGTVTPATPSTLPFDPPGRVGQWLLGEDNDLTLNSWELSGTVTLMRTDDARSDRNKVRLAVDFVNDTRIPPPSLVPLPAALPLFASALGLLGAVARRRRSSSR